MKNSISANSINVMQKNIIARTAGLKNERQIKFLEYVAKMTSWEFEVFDAFRARLRVDELKIGYAARNAYELFLENPRDDVARLLVSINLHSWRPTGITLFAKLIEAHQERNNDDVLNAIIKASTISSADFREEYPTYAKAKSNPPKLILETILEQDFNIVLVNKKIDTTPTYDGLRDAKSKT